MSRPSIIENSKYSYAISNEYHKTSGTVSPKREVPSSNQYLRQKITLKRGSRKVQAAEAKAKKFSHKLRWECTTKVWSCSVCLLEDSRNAAFTSSFHQSSNELAPTPKNLRGIHKFVSVKQFKQNGILWQNLEEPTYRKLGSHTNISFQNCEASSIQKERTADVIARVQDRRYNLECGAVDPWKFRILELTLLTPLTLLATRARVNYLILLLGISYN